jgi:hypothetical protein
MRLPEPKNIVIIHKTQQRQAQKWCQEQLGQRWEAIGNRSGRWCCFWAGTKDYDKYPRMTETDGQMLREHGCDILFLPSVDEMYQHPLLEVSPLNIYWKLSLLLIDIISINLHVVISLVF